MLTQVRVHGFKAIKDSGPVSLGALTLFIGRNGSGKSSFLEALQWLQEATRDGLQLATDSRFGSFDTLRNRRVLSKHIGIELTLQDLQREVHYELWVKPHVHQRPIVESETCREDRKKGSALTTISSRKGSAGPSVRSIAKGNPVRDGDTLALSQVAGTAARGAERLHQHLSNAIFLRLSPTAMTGRVRLRKARGPVLDEEGRNLATLLANMTAGQLAQVSEHVANILQDFEGVDVSKEGDLGYLSARERMKLKGGTRAFDIPAWLLSEGTRRLTAIFALLAVEPRPSLIAIEEVENGLDPWTLQYVFKELRQASEQGIQILLTTHSPLLLDHVEPEEVIHVTREKGETLYTPIGDYKQVEQYRGMVPPGAMYISGYFKDRRS